MKSYVKRRLATIPEGNDELFGDVVVTQDGGGHELSWRYDKERFADQLGASVRTLLRLRNRARIRATRASGVGDRD